MHPSPADPFRTDSITRPLAEPLGRLLQLRCGNFLHVSCTYPYTVAVREFIRFHGFESREALYAAKPAHLIAWQEDRHKNGATAKTVRSRLAAVSSLFKHLCEHQLVPRNPAQGVKRPKTNQQRVEAPVLTAEQGRTLLECPDSSTL